MKRALSLSRTQREGFLKCPGHSLTEQKSRAGGELRGGREVACLPEVRLSAFDFGFLS